jgi:hypothetical protein
MGLAKEMGPWSVAKWGLMTEVRLVKQKGSRMEEESGPPMGEGSGLQMAME